MTAYGVIYRFTNHVNGKRYVGLTVSKDPVKYCLKHLRSAYRTRRQKNKVFYQAIRKHGPSVFTFEIIWTAFDKAALDDAEDFFIRKFKTLVPLGYNMKGGGDSGRFSDEMKANHRIALKKAYADPEVRRRKGLSVKAAASRPEIRAARLLRENLPENKRRRSEQFKSMHAKPEFKAQFITLMQELWTKPEVRANRLSGMQRRWNKQEERSKQGERIRQNWAKPGAKEKVAASIRARNATVEYKEKWKGSFGKRYWANNGLRSRRIKENEPLPDGWVLGRGPF